MSNDMVDTAQLLVYLKAYHADLAYQFKQDGFEYVNSASCGTPYFESDEEAQKYLTNLSDFTAKVYADILWRKRNE